MAPEKVRVEEFHISGDALLDAIKDLVHQGNVRRIAIRNEAGRTLIEIPLFVGVAGAALLPVWAAIGALASLVAHFSIVVERVEEPAAGGGNAEDPPQDAQR